MEQKMRVILNAITALLLAMSTLHLADAVELRPTEHLWRPGQDVPEAILLPQTHIRNALARDPLGVWNGLCSRPHSSGTHSSPS